MSRIAIDERWLAEAWRIRSEFKRYTEQIAFAPLLATKDDETLLEVFNGFEKQLAEVLTEIEYEVFTKCATVSCDNQVPKTFGIDPDVCRECTERLAEERELRELMRTEDDGSQRRADDPTT